MIEGGIAVMFSSL